MQAQSLCAGVEGCSLLARAGRRSWWIYAANLKMHALQESSCKEEIFSSGQVFTIHCLGGLGLDMKGWSGSGAVPLCLLRALQDIMASSGVHRSLCSSRRQASRKAL